MVVSRQDGRLNQKRRTRRAIIDAATQLVRGGRQPSVAEAAQAALVSKATAYRYFPTQQSLLMEIQLETIHPSSQSVLEGVAEHDPQARFDAIVRSVHAYMTKDEALGRTFIKLSQERWLESVARGEPDPVVREGRRREYIDAILEPLLPQLSTDALARLRFGLALVIGIEPIAMLKDVHGLSSDEALAILRWVGATLIEETRKSDAR